MTRHQEPKTPLPRKLSLATSATTTIPASSSKSPANTNTTRPTWHPPSGKSLKSPTRLPAPTFHTSSTRKSKSPSPCALKSKKVHVGCGLSAPACPVRRVEVTPSKSALLSNDDDKTNAIKSVKRDSLSPLHSHSHSYNHHQNHNISSPTKSNHKRKLSPILNSPSTTHPYISKTHVAPSCTTGSLTHRLHCGHLVSTLHPDVCGRNCAGGAAAAEISDGGFAPGMRDLDCGFVCAVCANMLLATCLAASKDVDVKAAVEEFGRSLHGSSEAITHADLTRLTWLLESFSLQQSAGFVSTLGKNCIGVVDGAVVGDLDSFLTFFSLPSIKTNKKKVEKSEHVITGAGEWKQQRFLHNVEEKGLEGTVHVKLVQEGRLKRLFRRGKGLVIRT